MDRTTPAPSAPGRVIGIALLLALAMACDPLPPVRLDPQNMVSAARFRTHMTKLAGEAMQGRETGTDGYLLAADYVAAQFAAYGLVPMGDQGSWFQQVPLLSARLEPGSAGLEIRHGDEVLALAFGEDFVSAAGFTAGEVSVTAPLLYIGYGVHAPQHGHDDFAGVDCTGRILVRLTGAPPGFPADERAFHSSGWVKDSLAVGCGAVGVITVRTPVDLPRLPWQRYTAAIGSSEMRWAAPGEAPFETFPQLAGEAVLSEAAASRLFALAGHDLEALFERLDAGGTGSFELGLEAAMTRRSVHRRLSAPNVIGMIPGSDPALREEYLLFSAHLDHLGVRGEGAAREVHEGAYDNAAGVATVLEVARVMSAIPGIARRSVVFVALAAEEQGLQGSAYLAHHPPWPDAGLAAVINVDMPYLGFPIAEIIGLGVEHSSLQAALAGAAGQVGLQYIPDPRPELVRFIRSDQYSFVRRGVPGLNLKPGARSSDPAIDGPALHDAYLKDHYHQPGDDAALAFSPEGSERFTRVALLMGLEVANADRRPAWNPGDFFAGRFAAGREGR